MSRIVDAQDELAIARNLVELILMTTRSEPDDEQKALAAGCDAALTHIEKAEALLEETKQALRQGGEA